MPGPSNSDGVRGFDPYRGEYQLVRLPFPSLSSLQLSKQHEKMKLSRIWWLTTLATGGSAITLIDVLSSYPELSALHSWANASSNVTSLLASANNFTFLAATNDAVGKYLSRFPNNLTEDVLEATFQYSLLRGGFPSLSFTNTSQFVATNLVNARYANVTGGQAVELVLGAGGNPQVVTGNRSIATSTSAVCPKAFFCFIALITRLGYYLRRRYRPYNRCGPYNTNQNSPRDHGGALGVLRLDPQYGWISQPGKCGLRGRDHGCPRCMHILGVSLP